MTITCCSGLQNLLSNAGQRGIAVLVRRTSDGISLMLQSRGIAFNDEPKLRPVPMDLDINVSCSVGLRFCPFCGRNLEELVKASPRPFEKLADDILWVQPWLNTWVIDFARHSCYTRSKGAQTTRADSHLSNQSFCVDLRCGAGVRLRIALRRREWNRGRDALPRSLPLRGHRFSRNCRSRT
jgi:hypothetical protein